MIRVGMRLRWLTLSGALVMTATTGAVAAPVEYVRVCTLFGAGWFYVPGTDRCAQASDFATRQVTEYGVVASAPGQGAVAFGRDGYAYGRFSTAIGTGAWAGGDPNSDPSWEKRPGYPQFGSWAKSAFFNRGTTAIGHSARAGAGATGQINATAVGQDTVANAADATALGQKALASAESSSALGQGAKAIAANSVALGAGSIADEENTVSVGGFRSERRITHVEEGRLSATSTDAVNASQLFSTNQQLAVVTDQVAALTAVLAELGAATDADLRAGSLVGRGIVPGAVSGSAGARTVALGNGSAAGANGVAIGAGAQGTGRSSAAVGAGAQATAAGTTGLGAGAIADGDRAAAIGFQATASADDATAIGASASAGGVRATAIGRSANAAGRDAMAIGYRASAAETNSIAIGNGVATTRANQVAIGSARNTYTLAGVGSGASRAAQTGEVRVVTSDRSGNLALSDLDLAGLSGLNAQFNGLAADVGRLERGMKRAYEGSAIAMSMAGATLPAGKTFALSANVGAFEGEQGFSAGAIARIDDGVLVQGGVGVGSRGTVGGRAGLIFAW